LKTGKKYAVFIAPAAHRAYKKLDKALQEKVKLEARKIAEDPYAFKELRGPLKGIRSCPFTHEGADYRIAYRVNEEQQRIEILLVKSRENFYKLLSKLLK
jgi:addiction module RelE/StbE family toxin